MKYNPNEIEAKWQKYWSENQTFKALQPNEVANSSIGSKGAYYVLDMFPYPSGAGLHVGHPLGYIASDIVARYKRHQGFNVLHPQGYDSFGLPAEQYAIQTGQHPEKTTRENIARYREQLDRIGFSFDWSREVRTSNPEYYKHTQWIFIQLFESWYNKDTDKAESICTLMQAFEKNGNAHVNAVCDDNIAAFTAEEWKSFSSEQQQKILLQYRLTYLAETEVNWCPALGTVLANDEIVNGVSERGGHPVIRKKMTQWSMRISAYAERLLQGLNDIDWSESIKEAQRNWIGKSVGAEVFFPILSFPKGEEKSVLEKTAGYMTGGSNSHINIHFAKEHRKNPTEAEKILWNSLRNKNLGEKFRQQHLIDNYIVDFVCLSKKLVIEVDGGYHSTQEQKLLDNDRTIILESKGYKVIRFTNEEIIGNLENVLIEIKSELNSRNNYHVSPPLTFGEGLGVRIFTTRPDTIFGVTFMTLAPEHDLVSKITTAEQKQAVESYIEATAKRSERERMADVKTISGVFTGAYAEHPLTKEPIPIWIGDYVLAGYGTGAVMAVPCGDERDYAFANFFKGTLGMPEIKNIFSPLIPEGGIDASDDCILTEAFSKKEGFVFKNSDFLNGLGYKEGTKKAIEALEEIGAGKAKVNYRLRDAVFSRQRYWGEPFPVYYVNGLPQMIDKQHLPIVLPEVEKYLPTEDGQPPLGNATNWAWDSVNNKVVSNDLLVNSSEVENQTIFPLELNTMPGWAGSSWYWMRYMDAHNENEFASEEALQYWQNVDLYIGGSEHATGHLLYARFWNKFLKDRGYAPTEEPFKKLINQGMILGMSAKIIRITPSSFIYKGRQTSLPENIREKTFLIGYDIFKKSEIFEEEIVPCIKNEILKKTLEHFVKENLTDSDLERYKVLFNLDIIERDLIEISEYIPYNKINVDIDLIDEKTDVLDLNRFFSDYKYSHFISSPVIYDNNKFIVGREVEKMSKSKYNVVNPDDICNEYGADTLRLYEMFLGPLEQAKPWNTAGITGVFGFLKKLWRLYFNDAGFNVVNDAPTAEMYKSLHKTIKKVTEDIENFSFNTSVSQFMICVNELQQLKCNHRAILEPLAVLVSPYAPHIAEELWSALGHEGSITTVEFPKFEPKYLVESEKEYPISFNGKMRFTMKLPLDLTKEQIQEIVMADERTKIHLENKEPEKIIIVPGKIINLVGLKKQNMSNKELFIDSYLNKISKRFELKKDYSFEVFSIATVLDKGFDEVQNNIRSLGSRDGGIDGIYFEEFGSYYLMHVFQCKNSKSLKQNELDKFRNDVKDIFVNGLIKPNTDDIKDKIEEHKNLTKLGYVVEVKMYFIYNGENNDPENSSNSEMVSLYNKQNDNFEIWDSESLYRKINDLVKAQNKRENIEFTFKPVKSNVVFSDNQALYSYSINNVSAVNFRIPALDLCELIDLEIERNKTHDFLFSENIRGFLGLRSKANQKMKKTLDNPNESFYFPFLNNGITIISETLTLPNGPQQGLYNIPTKNPVIVNGLQTTRVIYSKYKEDLNSLQNVFINVRLYQTNDNTLIEKITDATNTQTPINFKDKISNKSFNDFTKELFENNEISYLTKRGETFNTLSFNESVQSETVLKFWYASFYEKPEIAKNSISKVLEDIYDATNSENILKDLFNDDKNSPIYKQLLISYKIYRKVVEQRKLNVKDEFIKYSDELLTYGIYKELCNDLENYQIHLNTAYNTAYNFVKLIVDEEYKRYAKEEKAFSYNSYFKTPRCRIQYNEKANILENEDIILTLKSI